jgi:hypothetical protein
MATSGVPKDGSCGTGWEKAPEGLRWRVIFSIVVPIAWLSATLLYVGFWASGFTLFQSIVLVIVSALIMGGAMGVVWTIWGPKYRHAWD